MSSAAADEYARARAALIACRELPEGGLLASQLYSAMDDLGAFARMIGLTREAEALVAAKATELERGSADW